MQVNTRKTVTVQGPRGVTANPPKSYDSSKGPLGMRQMYKETGKPGNGSK